MYTFIPILCIVAELYYFYLKGVGTPQNRVYPPRVFSNGISNSHGSLGDVEKLVSTITWWVKYCNLNCY